MRRDDDFHGLARILAQPIPRRRALRLPAGSLAAVALQGAPAARAAAEALAAAAPSLRRKELGR